MNSQHPFHLNPVVDWGQDWLDVMTFDEVAAKRGLDYVYSLFKLPAPEVVYVDGWKACLTLLQQNHPDPKAFNVDYRTGVKPLLPLLHTSSDGCLPHLTTYLDILRSEVLRDWETAYKVYDLDRNQILLAAYRLLSTERKLYDQRWQHLEKAVSDLFLFEGGKFFYLTAISQSIHYLKGIWLHLDAIVWAAQLANNPLLTTYNWPLLLDFVKAKSFATYPLHDVVYCVRPPVFIGKSFRFENGEEYTIPMAYQSILN